MKWVFVAISVISVRLISCLLKNEYLSRLIIVRKIYVNNMVLGDGLIRGVIWVIKLN